MSERNPRGRKPTAVRLTVHQKHLGGVHTSYSTAGVGKRVRGTRVYHSRQCGVVLKRRSDCTDYILSFASWHTAAAQSCEDSSSASWVCDL